MNLHASSSPARLHIIFPATVFTDSYEARDRVKSDLTKELAENDRGRQRLRWHYSEWSDFDYKMKEWAKEKGESEMKKRNFDEDADDLKD
ncbi:MAG: hypothetical protein LQ343_005514 [Gyalolechia ehrenbergii]|nr:MAG: hypothetical protein LQ343_005514 [Gyalolechia ehrenbergii]